MASSTNCTCDDNGLGNLGRPKCVHEMPAIAFPVFWPRYDEDGDRNTINVASPTLGQDIQDLIQTASTTFRIYPAPKTENVTAERTETVYETFPSGRKVKIPGVGGIRTFMFELVEKDSVNAILRELQRYGCSDIDFGLVDVQGGFWLYKENPSDTEATGFKMDSGTFDAFKVYATDTTTAKITLSFDLDRFENEANGYVLTPSELGYPATTLRGLITGYQTAVPVTTTTATVTVTNGFGTASETNKIVGLLSVNFTAYNVTAGSPITVTSAENLPGVYTLTYSAPAAAEVVRISVNADGYEIADTTFVQI